MDEDSEKVVLAKLIKQCDEQWVQQSEIIRCAVRSVRHRYEELIKAGFNDEQAMRLCVQDLRL